MSRSGSLLHFRRIIDGKSCEPRSNILNIAPLVKAGGGWAGVAGAGGGGGVGVGKGGGGGGGGAGGGGGGCTGQLLKVAC